MTVEEFVEMVDKLDNRASWFHFEVGLILSFQRYPAELLNK